MRRVVLVGALALTVFGLGASGAAAGAAGPPKRKSLDLPEGTIVDLQMCYFRDSGLVKCSRPQAAIASADTQLLFVHGYGDASQGKDCNGGTWRKALDHFLQAGRERESLTTIGFYAGDERCDVRVASATNETPIQDVARELANYIDRSGQPVDIVAHSMGGLVARVALLGSAQGWEGFPPRKLDVDDVVTLGTPHRGVSNPSAHADRQWRQMDPGSSFISRLHEDELGDAWADGTDWSLVGSEEDRVVSYRSAIDKGAGADQKYGYRKKRDGLLVDHEGLRTLAGESRYALDYWHAAGGHPPHTTDRGWSPLKAAFEAATRTGDGLPR